MNQIIGSMLRFENAHQKWWQKPLVLSDGRAITAELAILFKELAPGEKGAWLNSRGLVSGVADLISHDGQNKTKRIPLPAFVMTFLKRMHSQANVRKGIPDLVIWNEKNKQLRFVECKCPHWDKQSEAQKEFFRLTATLGIEAKVVEWEFNGYTG